LQKVSKEWLSNISMAEIDTELYDMLNDEFTNTEQQIFLQHLR
jgi:hypothetical protein